MLKFQASIGLCLLLAVAACNHENDRSLTPANGTTTGPEPATTAPPGASPNTLNTNTGTGPASGTPTGSGMDTTGSGSGNSRGNSDGNTGTGPTTGVPDQTPPTETRGSPGTAH